MVRKQSQKQKQSVNVKIHIGDTNKKRKRRNYKRKAGVSQGVNQYSAQAQPYHPVYIQSGTPEPENNPLLRAIQELNTNVVKNHVEQLVNPLLNQVPSRGHIIGEPPRTYHRSHNINLDEIYKTNSDVKPEDNPLLGSPLGLSPMTLVSSISGDTIPPPLQYNTKYQD